MDIIRRIRLFQGELVVPDKKTIQLKVNTHDVCNPKWQKIFKDRTLSVLEAMVEYLKEKQNLTYHQIALLLNRDEGNIRNIKSPFDSMLGSSRKNE